MEEKILYSLDNLTRIVNKTKEISNQITEKMFLDTLPVPNFNTFPRPITPSTEQDTLIYFLPKNDSPEVHKALTDFMLYLTFTERFKQASEILDLRDLFKNPFDIDVILEDIEFAGLYNHESKRYECFSLHFISEGRENVIGFFKEFIDTFFDSTIEMVYEASLYECGEYVGTFTNDLKNQMVPAFSFEVISKTNKHYSYNCNTEKDFLNFVNENITDIEGITEVEKVLHRLSDILLTDSSNIEVQTAHGSFNYNHPDSMSFIKRNYLPYEDIHKYFYYDICANMSECELIR